MEPIEVLLEKVERGEINPYDVDLKALIEDFRQRLGEVSLPYVGLFLEAIVRLLKLELEYFFPSVEIKSREKKITLKEVKEALEDLNLEDLLPVYQVPVGRPKGSIGTPRSITTEKESLDPPLHKTFSPKEYIRRLKEYGLEDWQDVERFLLSLTDRVERVRFLMAWLIYQQD